MRLVKTQRPPAWAVVATFLLLSCLPAAGQESARTDWLMLGDWSSAVVVGVLVGPKQSVEQPNARTPRMLRDSDGSYRVELRDPNEYTVGEVWRLSVEEVVKGDGRVAPGGLVDVFHQGHLFGAQAGHRYLLFLRSPIELRNDTDRVNGWRNLYGTILTRPDSTAEAPFDPSNAYSVAFAPRAGAARAALEVTQANAAEVEAIKIDLRAQGMPSARIVTPARGALVTGAVALSAIAVDDVGVLGVQFRVDDRDLGTEVTPQGLGAVGMKWDTRAVTDGLHALFAVARDGAGNRVSSAPVAVTVDNTPPVLHLSAQPGWLWPADGRLVPIIVGLTVTDAQDPSPSVQLVSITCEEGFRVPPVGIPENRRSCTSATDIVGATPGADVREFQLRATKLTVRNTRVYTIAYSARDAAGNQTTAKVIVQVGQPPPR